MNKGIIKVFLFVIFLISITAQSKSEFFSIENRLKFGNYLFCAGDYIRAIDEYKFVLNEKDNDSLKFKIGLAYQKLNRYEDAVSFFEKLIPDSHLKNEADFEYYRTVYFLDDFEKLKKEYWSSSFSNPSYENEIKKLLNISDMYSEYETADSSLFFKPFNEKESIELLKFYFRKQNLGNKSPVTAALLSAVVPGLGKIYTENYGDGITALLLTGILTFLSIDNFNADHDFRGWLFAGMAANFYAGNIYGSAASAQIYNANVRITFDNDLKLFLNKKNHFIPKSKWFCE